MRAVRVVVPALVAVVAWFASGALSTLGMASGSPALLRVTRLVAPDTLPVGITAPEPWSILVGVAIAVAIGGLFALLALVFGADRAAPRIAGFAAAWAAAVVAGTIVGGLPLVFALAEALLHTAAAPLPTLDLAATGAYWGVVWGWLPALAAALLATVPVTRPLGTPGAVAPLAYPVVLAVSAGVAAIGLAGVAVASPIADAAWHARISDNAAAEAAEAAEREAGLETGTGNAPPPATPPADAVPIPEIAPGDWRIDPTWCTENQLAFAASRPDAATGHRGMRVTATNVSTAPCTVDGYPDLAFSDPVTNGFEVRVLHGSGMLGEPDAGAVAVELPPGGTAEVDVTWDAPAHSDRDPAGFLHIAAYPGAVRQFVPIDTDIVGGEVEVTAWRLPTEDPAAAG
ncbi:DUF4232 domain-containing protein [Agromyces larvae]|uniref:DUF4232 domain-containing protein n=1 Tax=Agromyces larvae TaxID=2929802 RepID=A0ABY4C362_9MICO|nr:DUF4232 domain-containing protein [Agromyces larvae]UOE45798.1 DUF4232 domain-containing protein [Agromyces larvae]